ncbi:hypothetical protein [Marinobacter lutaoensis]|nr:hypothetical protein [Marinobacter lutaoensis]
MTTPTATVTNMNDKLTQTILDAALKGGMNEVVQRLNEKDEITPDDLLDVVRDLGEIVRQRIHQRDVLAQSILKAAVDAGMIKREAQLSGPEILDAINNLGSAAKETVQRNLRAIEDERILNEFLGETKYTGEPVEIPAESEESPGMR